MRARTFLEITAWATGGLALATYGGARYWQHAAHAQGLARFESARLASEGDVARTPASSFEAERVDTSNWSSRRITQYEETIRDNVTPEGVLQVPSVNLRVPIYEGTSERNLHRGAGRIEGTAQLDEQGNIAIAAHRDGFFRVLEKVAVGDIVTIEHLSGVQTYRITQTLIVAPSDVGVLRSTGLSMVTLVTCYPFYYVGAAPKRFIVHAVRIESPKHSDAAGSGTSTQVTEQGEQRGE
jgi:sortase A